jgi:hypothetical protein
MLLKHIDNQDVAIETLKSYFIKEKQEWSIKVRWWNVGVSHPPWCMNIEQKIRISKRDRLLKWKPYAWRPFDKQRIREIIHGNHTAPQSSVD